MIDEWTTKLGGAYALLLTPFDEAGRVDWPVYEQYLDWQLAMEPHALFAVCGSSEMTTLTPDEQIRLVDLAVRHAGPTPVVATANLQPSFADQVEQLHRIEQLGVTGAVATTRGYGGDQLKLKRYMARLAGESRLPLLAYEYPGYPDRTMEPETYGELVTSGAIVGVKDTTCTLDAITAKIAAAPASLVIQANVPLLSESVRRGASGAMTIVSAAGVGRVCRLWAELAAGAETAASTQAQLSALDSLLGGEFPAAAKFLLSLAGLPFTPRTRASAQLSVARREALRQWYETSAAPREHQATVAANG